MSVESYFMIWLLPVLLVMQGTQSPQATTSFEVEKPISVILATLIHPNNIELIAKSKGYNFSKIQALESNIEYTASKVKSIDAKEFKTEIVAIEKGFISTDRIKIIEEIIEPNKYIKTFRSELLIEKIDDHSCSITISLWMNYHSRSILLPLARRVGISQTRHDILESLGLTSIDD